MYSTFSWNWYESISTGDTSANSSSSRFHLPQAQGRHCSLNRAEWLPHCLSGDPEEMVRPGGHKGGRSTRCGIDTHWT